MVLLLCLGGYFKILKKEVFLSPSTHVAGALPDLGTSFIWIVLYYCSTRGGLFLRNQ